MYRSYVGYSHTLEWIPRSRMAGSYSKCVFNYLRSCKAVFSSDFNLLNFPEQFMRIPVSLYPYHSSRVNLFIFFNYPNK